ncbi:MAG: retroviral-like aspartic protease family protein [Deltaproteobacteria bacterium]|nr:retroviral-like aspartic protease family protein [Deltaproteobacteria bacterium]
MSTSSIEFPLSPLRTRTGTIPEPIIPIRIYTPSGFKSFDFLVDSGADMSVLPKAMASILRINLQHCPTTTTQGVEGYGAKIFRARIVIQLGAWTDTIRCAFVGHDAIPPLLGRVDVFSRYNITFHARRHSIFFERI